MLYSTVIIAEFEQVNAGWVWDNTLFLVPVEIYCPAGWEDLLGYMFSSSFTQNMVAKKYIFHNSASKR